MLKCRVYSFETLDVWKEARKLIIKIYKITGSFPAEERFGLVSQMRRAILSVGSNISEGSSRDSLRDQARYSEISFGSLMELLNDSIASFDLNFISEIQLMDVRLDIDRISTLLDGLRKSQINRHKLKRKSGILKRPSSK